MNTWRATFNPWKANDIGIIGAPERIDSDRLRPIFTPSGRAACVQNADAFCRTTVASLGGSHNSHPVLF